MRGLESRCPRGGPVPPLAAPVCRFRSDDTNPFLRPVFFRPRCAPSALRLAPDSLGFALDAAAQAVDAVRRGTALPAALATVFAQMPADVRALARGATQDVAYRTMRRLGSADWLIGRLVSKAPPAHVHAVLAGALALLLDPADAAAYPAFTVVDQAVTVIGARREYAFAKGLVNAVLRRFERERDTLVAALQDDPVARWNYRPWWIDAVKRAWPDAWQAVLAAGDRQGRSRCA
jgi:16S rRNA (cytosine967-C5)-methyltransferase